MFKDHSDERTLCYQGIFFRMSSNLRWRDGLASVLYGHFLFDIEVTLKTGFTVLYDVWIEKYIHN